MWTVERGGGFKNSEYLSSWFMDDPIVKNNGSIKNWQYIQASDETPFMASAQFVPFNLQTICIISAVSYTKHSIKHVLCAQCTLGVIHKPRGQLRGEGGYSNDYFVTLVLFSKSDHERGGEEGVKNTQNFVHVVYGWPPTKYAGIVSYHNFLILEVHFFQPF